jgi:hypothetical protein
LLPLLRGPQGERNGDVVVCSRMSSTMGNTIRTGGGEDVEIRRHTSSGQVHGRQGRSNMERERIATRTMGLMPPSEHPPPGRVRGRCRVQGRHHSDVSTARLPVSARTLRGCLIHRRRPAQQRTHSPPSGHVICASYIQLGCDSGRRGLPRGAAASLGRCLLPAPRSADGRGDPVLC